MFFGGMVFGGYYRIGVNHSAIVREIPHFDVFPAFLLERPAFLTEFREEKLSKILILFRARKTFFYVFLGSLYQIFVDTI